MPLDNVDRNTRTDINTDMTTPSAGYTRLSEHPIAPHPDPAHALPSPQRLPAGIRTTVIIIVLLVARRHHLSPHWPCSRRASPRPRKPGSMPSRPSNVISPTVSGTSSEIALPGNTQAFDDTPIYARTSGYLKQWFVDIGQHVTKGELMATIETPELDEQLQVAQADLKSAQADLDAREDNLRPISESPQAQLRLPAGDRRSRLRRSRQTRSRRSRRGQRPPPIATPVLRKNLCPLQRHRHTAQHRHR